jgi:hypothetical protein
LGFATAAADYFYRKRFHSNPIRPMPRDQQLAPPCKISGVAERERVLVGICRIARSPFSSRVSQNAAALLFDPETVDIRRVGTQI